MSNANLKVLRLEVGGISPSFSPDIKEYYVVVGGNIDNIDVSAEPENEEASVMVTGNSFLNYGKNTIEVTVSPNNGEQIETYTIFVTRTNAIERANANLENLAIKQGNLVPEFDANVTNYEVEVANDVFRIDALAIPQSENANVEIRMPDELSEGHNVAEITVLAEDNITFKKYKLDIYRRNAEEEANFLLQEEAQTERLSTLLRGTEAEMYGRKFGVDNFESLPIVILFVVVLIGIAGVVYVRRKKFLKNL